MLVTVILYSYQCSFWTVFLFGPLLVQTNTASGVVWSGWVQATHPRGGGHHSVGEHVEVQSHQLEDVLEQSDDLEGQHVLREEEGGRGQEGGGGTGVRDKRHRQMAR